MPHLTCPRAPAIRHLPQQ